MIKTELTSRNDFIFGSNGIINVSLTHKRSESENKSLSQLTINVTDEVWYYFLRLDTQPAKSIELSMQRDLLNVPLYCNINPPFCPKCFDHCHSKLECPHSEQFCATCGRSHRDSEPCDGKTRCPNCLRSRKEAKADHHYYHPNCPNRKQMAVEIENSLYTWYTMCKEREHEENRNRNCCSFSK